VLRRIDWSTPANILEKIIRYEAVHEIRDWNDLRRRIDPVDRRCYAFFHPALNDEPLIFVEVALTETIPGAIAPLLAEQRELVPIERARTAVFYSISNTQRGLGGISFGSFLIKQVAEELRRELPKLDSFVTLSPVPGFMQWLREATDVPLSEEDRLLLESLGKPDWFENAELAAQLRTLLEPLAAYYFLKARTPKGRLIDSVARFHLGNGARLERINWLGDLSPKGLRESAGIMVNYDSLAPRTVVVPAKAGTHNHRKVLWREQAVAAEHITSPCGYGSRLRQEASPRHASPGRRGERSRFEFQTAERM
jgi:malonyl-CoA decarboxylase